MHLYMEPYVILLYMEVSLKYYIGNRKGNVIQTTVYVLLSKHSHICICVWGGILLKALRYIYTFECLCASLNPSCGMFSVTHSNIPQLGFKLSHRHSEDWKFQKLSYRCTQLPDLPGPSVFWDLLSLQSLQSLQKYSQSSKQKVFPDVLHPINNNKLLNYKYALMH